MGPIDLGDLRILFGLALLGLVACCVGAGWLIVLIFEHVRFV